MSITRRDSLAGILVGGTALSLTACENTSNPNDTNSAISKKRPKLPQSPTTLLLNQIRAAEVMEQEKVDLIICADPLNIYYLTNQRPMTYRLGMNILNYATLSSKPLEAPTFISGRYSLYMGGAFDTDISDDLNFKMHSIPANPDEFAALTKAEDIINAAPFEGFYPRLHDKHPLPPHVQTRRGKDASLLLTDHYAASESSLLKQIFETDMPHKTVAIDNPEIRKILEKTGLNLRIVDGTRLVKKIRLQKTTAELELVRHAVTANANAARAAAKSVRDGASLQDLRGEFTRACAERLNIPVYMAIDFIIPELIEGEIKNGRSFMVDCVSQFQGYHGDFGRTVCVGEPTKEMQSIIDALSHVWDRIMPILKAGTKYSDIYALSTKLFAETGVDAGFAVNPHSVGLQHTDEPSRTDFGQWSKDDIELVENMVLSVDMPVLDNGLGGSAHLEDLVLIGKDGPELLNTSDDRFIVV